MKVTLDYDPASGQLTDKSGSLVGTWVNLQPVDDSVKKLTPAEAIQLREAGFTAEDLVELRKRGLL